MNTDFGKRINGFLDDWIVVLAKRACPCFFQSSINPPIQQSIFFIRVHPCPSVVDLIGDENKRIALNVPSFPESKQHK
jgi:hypothetical protein